MWWYLDNYDDNDADYAGYDYNNNINNENNNNDNVSYNNSKMNTQVTK